MDSTLSKNAHQTRVFEKQNKRKQIDTFKSLNASRFEPIEKSPQNLSSVKKVTGVGFDAYKRRESLFPKTDESVFYDTKKEFVMKDFKAGGALHWNRMANRTTVSGADYEMPEDSYDIMKATEIRTQKVKPRSIVLADFGKTSARDEMLLRTNDAYANVQLENTKEERELEL